MSGENYTKIENQILEQIARIKLSPTQYRLIFVIWRNTCGFHREEHTMSLSYLSEATGCDKRQIQRELKGLDDKNIIHQKIKNGSHRLIGFNKNTQEWMSRSSVGELAIGETTIGGIDNGQTDNPTIGEIDNGTIGETVKATIGETDNQERKKKRIKEISKERSDQMDKPNPFSEYEKLFGHFPSPMLVETFTFWIEGESTQFQEPEAIICESIRRAKLNAPRHPAKLIETILKNLHNLQLYTLEAVKEYNEKFDQNSYRHKQNGQKQMSGRPSGTLQPATITEADLQEIRKMEADLPY